MSSPEAAGAARPVVVRDPETFYQAQRRNRRATWRMSALAAVAACLMGIPLTLVLTPFLYAICLLVAEVINHFWPLPPAFWQAANDLAKFVYRTAGVAIGQRGTLNAQEVATALALVFLPGILLAVALWLGIGLLFRHGGVGGTLASLNARSPNPTDLKELQLADTVQEMAIAAGLPAPQVRLVDSEGGNAAAIGTSAADAHIVLSRRLLDDLDRTQLQALVGHLVASVANGDLRIAFKVTSVFETCGLIVTLINAPFGRQSRSILWRIVRYPFRHGDRSVDAEEVAELLADTLEAGSSDIDRFFNSARGGLIRKAFRVAFLPLLFTNAAVELTLWFFMHVLLGPCMALVWRTRRYLADAGAVELTRNPDALAAALQRLSMDTTALAGGSWANHLFVVNPLGDPSLSDAGMATEQQRKALQAWRTAIAGSGVRATATPVQFIRPDRAEYVAIRKEIMSTVTAAAQGDAAAVSRMQTFVQTMGGLSAFGLQGMPNPNDILLAQRGDRAALARLRMLRQSEEPRSQSRHGRTGLQTYSFVSFHPPLDRREKRLQRMGARQIAGLRARKGIGAKIALTLLWIIIGPLIAAAGVTMLAMIVLMIGLNLLFLGLWLSIIHWAFAQDWGRILDAFVALVQQVATALGKSR